MLTDLRHLVIDEADTLFDESFESAITSILKDVKVFLQLLSKQNPSYNYTTSPEMK